MTKLHRLSLTTVALGTALALAGVASARQDCEGRHGEKRFESKDKNNDGFLTKDEVGDHWDHLKVADANKDGKISKAELEQAWKDGKLKRKHHPKA